MIFPTQKDNFPTTIYDPVAKGEKPIYYAGAINNLKIFSLSGQLFSTYNFVGKEIEIDLGAYQAGIYLLQIVTDTDVLVRKILKN